MKASYAWLRSLVPGLKASPADLAERLTCSGLEVEEVVVYGAPSPHVVLAAVRKVGPHPQRSDLKLVTVDHGAGEQTVVCGADNVPEPGDTPLVVLAPEGTHLPAKGVTVGKRDIGGVESAGMLCSEEELGLVGGGGKGAGILLLDPASLEVSELGAPLSRAIPASHDTVLDVSVTPNRPDALGHVGLAREIAALYELAFEPPTPDAPSRIARGDIGAMVSVQIDDTERCPHYGAAVVTEVTIGPSPAWLRYRLESLGIRAISNVVDITNLALLEFGHPLHAFDLDRLPEGKIVVRRAREGEKIVTLDGVERSLVDDDLVITDGARPVALAGVMGGKNTEIDARATRVLLECAYFQPRGVRRTSRRHGLQTESSFRFERGIDPEGVPDVLAHAASLVTRLCGGAAVPGSILAGVAPPKRPAITLRAARMDMLLGLSIPLDRAARILERLGCSIGARRNQELDVVPPSARPDLKREVDLIEEVVRVHGIDHVPATMWSLKPETGRSEPTVEERARRAALELGLSEAITFSFVAPRDLEVLRAPPASVRLVNPLTEDRSVMRTSALVGLLEGLRRARRHGVGDVRLFTVTPVFAPPADDGPLPAEIPMLAAVWAGRRGTGLGQDNPVDVYDAKGLCVELVERIGGRRARVEAGAAPHLHPRGAAEVLVGDTRVGRFGPLHPDVVDALELGGPCVVVEIDLAALGALPRPVPKFAPIPTLPAVTRDIALMVPVDVPAGVLGEAIAEAAGELCESVELFDVFTGKDVPDDHRSLAYHLVYRDPRAATDPENARTLTDKEVDARQQAMLARVRERHGAVVRGA